MDNPNSMVERVSLRGRETVTHLLTADEISIRADNAGGLLLELFRRDNAGKPVESYRFHLCPEDTVTLAREASTAPNRLYVES